MPDEPDRVARDVTVRGVVQGVGFRFHCLREAERLGVRGWVRNERDGSVAGHFEGTAEAVGALVAWCRSGPAYSRVDEVDERPATPRGDRTFSVG